MRVELRVAHELFSDFGMEAFAERARVELEATGEHARKRTDETRATLPQETQIARLARDGLSNAEIGARLFISKHTVEYHLGKVAAKLGINSRTKLARVLSPEPDSPHPNPNYGIRDSIGQAEARPSRHDREARRLGTASAHLRLVVDDV